MQEDAKLNNIKFTYNDIVNDILDTNNVEEKIYDRWEGVVVDNEDPEKLGRIKIIIQGIYDNIKIENIPWAIPDIQFIGSKVGNFIVPEKETIVRGYFDQGDQQKPIYDSVAFNKSNIDNSYVDTNEDYPFKMVLFETDQGDYCTLNRKNGEFAFIHRTGASIIFDGNGHISIDTGMTDTSNGNLNITVNGDTNIETTGDTKITSSTGKVIIDSEANMVELGKNVAKQLVNNFPNCVVTGVPHCIGNINVKC